MSKPIEVSGLGVTYSGIRALDDVSLEVDKGDFLGVMGPNGAGKSTLFSCILGLNTAYEGTVRVFGHDVRKSRAPLKKVGYVPQLINFERNFPVTVRDVIRFGMWHGVREERIDEVMQDLCIHDLGGRRIGELSGGQQQRVFIAKAIVNDPELLIMDEPVAGVDQLSISHFHDILKDLNSNHGITIMWSSHDLDAVSMMAKRVACIDKRMYYCGPVRKFFEDEDLVCMRSEGSRFLRMHERPHIQGSVDVLMRQKQQQGGQPHVQKSPGPLPYA